MKKLWKVFIIIGIVLVVIIGCCCLFFCTNLFRSTLLPINMKNISIQYIPTYSLSYEEEKNEDNTPVLELQTITLKDKDLKKMKISLKKIKKGIAKKKVDAIARVIIDKNTKLLIGEKSGVLVQGKKETPITYSTELSQLIASFIDQNNERIFTTISFESASIISDGTHITISNKDNMKLLKEYAKYFKMNRSGDPVSYGSSIRLIFDNQDTIYLYSDHSAYCVFKDTDPFYATYPEELLLTVQKILELSTDK